MACLDEQPARAGVPTSRHTNLPPLALQVAGCVAIACRGGGPGIHDQLQPRRAPPPLDRDYRGEGTPAARATLLLASEGSSGAGSGADASPPRPALQQGLFRSPASKSGSSSSGSAASAAADDGDADALDVIDSPLLRLLHRRGAQIEGELVAMEKMNRATAMATLEQLLAAADRLEDEIHLTLNPDSAGRRLARL